MEQLLKLDDESSSEDYKDYIYHFAVDENGLGGYLKVTFTQEPGQPAGAYMEFCINDGGGGNELIDRAFDISLRTAKQMIAVQFDGQGV